MDGVLVLIRGSMTAMELINTIEEIEKVSIDLSIHLAEACGTCTNCAECPCEDLGDPIIELPEHLLEEAGIPCNAKLVASVNEEENTVTVHQADHEHDLRDVPDWILDMMDGNNVCVGKLEEHLIAGYASYTKNLSATRSYPNLAGQDIQYIPKTIEDNGKTLTLQNIDWQTTIPPSQPIPGQQPVAM